MRRSRSRASSTKNPRTAGRRAWGNFTTVSSGHYEVANYRLGKKVNLALFMSGVGDGNYPVFVGLDAEGRPTRVLVDFLLLHFVANPKRL